MSVAEQQGDALPAPAAIVDFHISAEFDLVIGSALFTADQMLAYGRACRQSDARDAERLREALGALTDICAHVQVLNAFPIGKSVEGGRQVGRFMDAIKKAQVALGRESP